MPFSMKSQDQLVDDIVAWMQYASKGKLSDFNVGSINRSIAEAAAMNDYELYLQLAQLKEFNNLNLLTGNDLDERAIEYGLSRNPASPSIVPVVFTYDGVTTRVASTMTSGQINVGASPSSITLASVTGFPTSGGFVIIDRDNGNRERVRYSSITGTALNITSPIAWEGTSSATKSHASGASVILSQQGSDQFVAAGTVLSSPASNSRSYEVRFATNTPVVLLDGEVETSTITATSLSSGSSQNVSAYSVTSIESGAVGSMRVANPLPASGGTEIETDQGLQARIVRRVQGRIGGTPIAIEDAALNVTTVVDGGSVTCRLAKLVEPLDQSEPAYLYVHDGNSTSSLEGFRIVNSVRGSTSSPLSLIKNARSGQRRGRINNWPLVEAPKLYKALTGDSVARHGFGTASSASAGVLTDNTKSWVANVWVDKYLIDNNGYAAKITSNTTDTITVSAVPSAGLSAGPYCVIDVSAPLSASADFLTNLSSGEVELSQAQALMVGQWLVCWSDPTDSNSVAYRYFGGLIAEVQRVLNGDRNDSANYPGVKAYGSTIIVDTPNVYNLAVTVSITPQEGVQETVEMQELVRKTILSYVSSLNIGQAFVIAEAVARCQAVPGVYDTVFSAPASNVNVLPNELVRVSGTVNVQ